MDRSMSSGDRDSDQQTRWRPSTLRRRAALGLVGAVLLAAVAEGALVLFFPQPPRGFSSGLFEKRNELTFLRPGASGSHATGEFSVTVEGNAAGYRAGTWPGLEPGAMRSRVLILGDSYAFGWGVEAHETAAARLNALPHLAVYDLAMPGDGPYEEVQRLAHAPVPRANAAYVVLVFYDNDLSDLVGGGPEPARARLSAGLLRLNLVRLGGRFLDASGLGARASRLSGFADVRREGVRRMCAIHVADIDRRPFWTAARPLYERLAELVRGDGARLRVVRVVPPFLATDEARRRVRDEGLAPSDVDWQALDRLLGPFFRALGATYDVFTPPSEAERQAWFYPIDFHLTPEGQAALARFVAGPVLHLQDEIPK
jgi:hypothetical protein